MTAQTVIDLHHCSARRSMKVTVANTPQAEAAFIAYYHRRNEAAKVETGRTYGDFALDIWGQDDAEMTANCGEMGEALDALLFPTCEHGMSYHSCYGPDHFMSRDQEIARGEY